MYCKESAWNYKNTRLWTLNSSHGCLRGPLSCKSCRLNCKSMSMCLFILFPYKNSSSLPKSRYWIPICMHKFQLHYNMLICIFTYWILCHDVRHYMQLIVLVSEIYSLHTIWTLESTAAAINCVSVRIIFTPHNTDIGIYCCCAWLCTACKWWIRLV